MKFYKINRISYCLICITAILDLVFYHLFGFLSMFTLGALLGNTVAMILNYKFYSDVEGKENE